MKRLFIVLSILGMILMSVSMCPCTFAGDFSVDFTLGEFEYSKIPPKEDFIGTYYIHDGSNKYFTFNNNGKGTFTIVNKTTEEAEWGVEIRDGKPKTFTAEEEKLRTGTAYRIVWKCVNNCTGRKYTYMMVDTHWPKLLVGRTIYNKKN